MTINNLNINIIFKVAYADFIKLKKLIYTKQKKQSILFKELYLIHFNVILSEGNQYITLRLKYSKTNINYIEVLIMLDITNS